VPHPIARTGHEIFTENTIGQITDTTSKVL
jgi:hypothetical protein